MRLIRLSARDQELKGFLMEPVEAAVDFVCVGSFQNQEREVQLLKLKQLTKARVETARPLKVWKVVTVN
jgi:hypothetical protein